MALAVAMDRHGLIGCAGQLPWHLPADLGHFRDITLGKPVIMGRRTHESIGRPLPGRTNIVLSRAPGLRIEGCTVVSNLREALDAAAGHAEAMVIGGSRLYAEALAAATRIYVTEVHAELEGDTYFPHLQRGEWLETGRADHPADARHPYAYSFVVLERR
ncbi:MAG: dihydrofolate reductase [Gammaproteobacteria bacterium]